MYFKKMIGKKCYLSPIDVNDAEKFTEWLNDLEVIENMLLYPHIISLSNEKKYLEELTKGHDYSMIDIKTNELIGSCGFGSIDHINQTTEVGILIGNKKYWDNGFGTEALSLLMDYGFNGLNFHSICLRVYSTNERAIKCYEKIGFKIIGRRREAIFRKRKKIDYLYMDILVNEFYDKYKNEK